MISLGKHAETTLQALTSAFSTTDLVAIVACCSLIALVYKALEQNVATEKGRAWIVMLISSAVLSAFGTYYVARAFIWQLWNEEHIYGEDLVSRVVLLFFLSSNLMDLTLGLYHYPKYLDPFSTIAHHIFYVAFISVLLAHHYSRGFVLCFFMEIPTFVLALGSIWRSHRSDAIFGITFMLTRLFYNVWLAYKLYCISPAGTIWRVCCGVLCLHLFWFSKWSQKQGWDVLRYYLQGTGLLDSILKGSIEEYSDESLSDYSRSSSGPSSIPFRP